jgi:hypothetical protein
MSFGIYLTNLGANASHCFNVAPATSQVSSPAAAVAQKRLQQASAEDDIYFVKGEKSPELVSEILDMVGVPIFVAMFIVSAVNYLIRALASETKMEFNQTKVDIQLAVEKIKSFGAPDKREIILFRDENGTSTVGRVDLFVGQELPRLNPTPPQAMVRAVQPAPRMEAPLQMEELPAESEFEEIALN